jgi:hypothetical protein
MASNAVAWECRFAVCAAPPAQGGIVSAGSWELVGSVEALDDAMAPLDAAMAELEFELAATECEILISQLMQ